MNKLLVASLLLGFATAAVAEDPGDLAKKIINEPGDPHVDGAKASLRDDPAVHYERALELAQRVGSPSEIAWSQGLLAMALPARGADHLDRALEEAQLALDNSRASGCAFPMTNSSCS